MSHDNAPTLFPQQSPPTPGQAVSNETGLAPDWPELLPEATPGLIGEIVELATCNTEIDPVAVLVSLLVRFGATLGPDVHVPVGEQLQPPRLFAVKVGATSRARKGTSEAPIRQLFDTADESLSIDPDWEPLRVVGGPLSSGEGVVYEVRDPPESDGDDGDKKASCDSGVLDKRLLLIDPEFGGALRVLQREGNSLSAILRMAYDDGDIAPITKNNRIKATGAHICIVGHITQEELRTYLKKTEIWNGFANRILWVCVRRQGLVPIPSPMPKDDLKRVAKKLAKAIRFGRRQHEVNFSPSAKDAWVTAYAELTKDCSGIVGAVTSRMEAHARRLMLIYTLLDESLATESKHVNAALTFCDYCRESARHIFGDIEPISDDEKILEALRNKAMTKTEISRLFNGHRSSPHLSDVLNRLLSQGLIEETKKKGDGPPTTIYRILKSIGAK